MTHTRELIEVALPLPAINVESAREKSIRQRPHCWQLVRKEQP
jgi:adenine-specific DNA methylase